MKTLIAFIAVLSCYNNWAQSVAIHPTIEDVEVKYFSSPQTTLAPIGSNTLYIGAIPQVTVDLKANVSVSKIYFDILSANSNTIVYQISYPLNQSTVLNNGITMFSYSNGVVKLSNGGPLALKPYLYRIRTEDSLQVQTINFSLLK